MIRLMSVLFLIALVPGARAGTLDRVRAAGHVHCGLIGEVQEEQKTDVHGNLSDLAANLCHAIGVAALPGRTDMDVMKTELYRDEAHAYKALAAGEVDVAIGLTPTLVDAARRNIIFTTPFFLDGVTLLVRRDGPVHVLSELRGHQLCFLDGTHPETVMHDRIPPSVGYVPFPFEEDGEEQAALVTGRCQAMIGTMSQLAEARGAFHALVKDFVILPDPLTVDPAAAASDSGDPAWAHVVQATLSLEMIAWANGITATDASKTPKSAAMDHFDRVGASLGLDPLWATRTLSAVGHWGEVLDRTTGPRSAMDLPANPNRLWSQGGLIVPPSLD